MTDSMIFFSNGKLLALFPEKREKAASYMVEKSSVANFLVKTTFSIFVIVAHIQFAHLLNLSLSS